MNEQTTICHDCHGLKWKNINISLIFIGFICSLMPFITRWILATSKSPPCFPQKSYSYAHFIHICIILKLDIDNFLFHYH